MTYGKTDFLFDVFRYIDDVPIYLNSKTSLNSAKDYIRSYYRKGNFFKRLEFLVLSPFHSYHIVCTEECYLFTNQDY